jgi:exodeoxyribonuclease VII large subunit
VRADIESVVAVRFPGYPVLYAETNVSGPGAADAIVRAVEALDAHSEVDVIVLARGGGDAAQLLPFSDETLCRAIAACTTPVVSAVGHEGDRPLCDVVADARFGTPSLAAAAVVPSRVELEAGLGALLAEAAGTLAARVTSASDRLARIEPRAALTAGLTAATVRHERAGGRLALVHPRQRVAHAAQRLAAVQRHVDALSPARVLERGYAVVRSADGRVARDATALTPGSAVDVQFAIGHASARIEEVYP